MTSSVEPDPVQDVCNLGQMSYDTFKLWSPLALKTFLHIRKKPVEGSFEELAARAFVAWEEKVGVSSEKEHEQRVKLSEYSGKLKYGPNTIPDPFVLQAGWVNEDKGMGLWPSLYFSDISDYLQAKTPAELHHRLVNEYKEGKAYRYFKSDWCKKLSYHPISEDSTVCLFSNRVTPSMRLSNPAHQVWVAIIKDTPGQPGGKVHSAYCTCTAGLQGSCNHIAGLLFRVEYAVRTGMTKPTCTSVLASWPQPGSFVPSKPLKVSDQLWKKDHYFKQDEEYNFQQSTKKLGMDFTPLLSSQEQYVKSDQLGKDLANTLRGAAADSCFLQMHDSKPFPKAPLIKSPEAPINIAKQQALTGNLFVEELVERLKLEASEIEDLSNATTDQSTCEEWHLQRQGRITASSFHTVQAKVKSIEGKKDQVDTSKLVADIMGYKPRHQTAAMKHGSSMEPLAKRAYQREMKKRHKQFASTNAGLTVIKDHPFIGASPDLVVSCQCHGKGLCEIKCPYSICDKKPSADNYKHISCENKLLRTSPYFTQIQGQMGVLGYKYCDFFVYTSHGFHLERIVFDVEYWSQLLTKLSCFWVTYVSQELLSGAIAHHMGAGMATEIAIAEDHCYFKDSRKVPDTIPVGTKTSKGPLTQSKVNI